MVSLQTHPFTRNSLCISSLFISKGAYSLFSLSHRIASLLFEGFRYFITLYPLFVTTKYILPQSIKLSIHSIRITTCPLLITGCIESP